jgi:hypothetical protein
MSPISPRIYFDSHLHSWVLQVKEKWRFNSFIFTHPIKESSITHLSVSVSFMLQFSTITFFTIVSLHHQIMKFKKKKLKCHFKKKNRKNYCWKKRQWQSGLFFSWNLLKRKITKYYREINNNQLCYKGHCELVFFFYFFYFCISQWVVTILTATAQNDGCMCHGKKTKFIWLEMDNEILVNTTLDFYLWLDLCEQKGYIPNQE